MANTIIEDIHKIREEYAAQFNNDLQAICADARSKQGNGGRKVLLAHPKSLQIAVVDSYLAKLDDKDNKLSINFH